jgi:putative transposase
MNTERGSQFSLPSGSIGPADPARISIDGRGRCMGNIFIERLWRSLRQEVVYLEDIADGFQARRFQKLEDVP